jgi:hypothetical protein
MTHPKAAVVVKCADEVTGRPSGFVELSAKVGEVADVVGVAGRLDGVAQVLTEASASDPTLAEVFEQLQAQRLAGMGRFAQLLAERGAIRPDLSVDEVRDLLWTLTSSAIYDLLVVRQGWTPQRYRNWLADTPARTFSSVGDDIVAVVFHLERFMTTPRDLLMVAIDL